MDLAEDEDKKEKVRAINAGGTQNIAYVCKTLDCKMTYISTDYVFDGQGEEPWEPDDKNYARSEQELKLLKKKIANKKYYSK